jgi:hypothetical protein
VEPEEAPIVRPATEKEIASIVEIQGAPDTDQSSILRSLIDDPRVWYHIRLNEIPGSGNLNDQIEGLIAEGASDGFRIDTIIVPGHPDGGFFARRWVE